MQSTLKTPTIKLCWYDVVKKELNGSQISKAKAFVKKNLVRRLTPSVYHILPIQGYNKTTYTIIKSKAGFACNCQFYVKAGKQCSHIAAVMLYDHQQRGRKEFKC